MEALAARLALLAELRDGFFEREPKGTEIARNKLLRQAVDDALKDVPSWFPDTSSFSWELACGRLRNACPVYDPKAEEHLSRAVKMEPNSAEAWRELAQCMWKKPDLDTAIDCFESSLKLARDAQTLCGLAMALRRKHATLKDEPTRLKIRERSLTLSEEAVKVAGENGEGAGTALFSLGNARLSLFFGTGQIQPKFLVGAIEAYHKALDIEKEYRNPDLHLNLATALRYDEAYAATLSHLAQAQQFDPEGEAAERRESLVRYLKGMHEAIARKGRQKPKRLTQMTSALSIADAGVFATLPLKLSDGTEVPLKESGLDTLVEGENRGGLVIAVVVAVVHNDDSIPFTFAVCDREGACAAVTVYNFSSAFTLLIGDTVAISEPFLNRVQDLYVEGLPEPLSFRSVRVQNPAQIVRNRKRLGSAHVALSVAALDNKA